MLSSMQGMVSNYENSYWTFCTIIIMSRGRVHLMSVFKKVFAELNPDRVCIIGKKNRISTRELANNVLLTSSPYLTLTLLWFYGPPPLLGNRYIQNIKRNRTPRLILNLFILCKCKCAYM